MKLGIIGCGNMGEAILSGSLFKKIVRSKDVFVYDIARAKASGFRKKYGVRAALSSNDAAKKADIIVIAVKPQDSQNVLNEIKAAVVSSKTLVSIMAGVKIASIEKYFDLNIGIARVMPNMAAFCMESVSGISYNLYISEQNRKKVRRIFQSVGDIYETTEDRLNAITAITGSGPAYFFYIAEALIEAALEHGFSEKDALRLVLKTFHGASGVLKKLGAHPEALRKMVTSKGGTTEQAINIFEKSKVKKIFKKAVMAAHKRAQQLSR